MVDRVTYRAAGEYAIIHLVADALTHDPQPQIDALLKAGFRELGTQPSSTATLAVSVVLRVPRTTWTARARQPPITVLASRSSSF